MTLIIVSGLLEGRHWLVAETGPGFGREALAHQQHSISVQGRRSDQLVLQVRQDQGRADH
jgi:hypothetical protein